MDRPAPPPAPRHVIDRVVRQALLEDLGERGDVTSQACVPAATVLSAQFRARADGVAAGADCLGAVFAALDPAVRVSLDVADGADLRAGHLIATVSGPARAILAGERVALNLLSRLSGIATLTAAYVRAVAGTRATVAGTRKTTPGLRALEKHAILAGGGAAHRFGLDDAILIKDNHVAAAGGAAKALAAAKAHAGHMTKIAIEVDTLDQLREVIALGPDVVMLDNFGLTAMAEAVDLVAGRCVVEASGGVTLESVRAIAETGVDVISVGALTHSAPALDIGLDVVG